MDTAQLTWISNFIWNIADDVLRDICVRGKYRDVILPMTVNRMGFPGTTGIAAPFSAAPCGS